MNSKNPEEALAAIREEVNALNVPEATKGLNEAVSQWLKTQIQTKTIKVSQKLADIDTYIM